jgi:hypothetical protein
MPENNEGAFGLDESQNNPTANMAAEVTEPLAPAMTQDFEDDPVPPSRASETREKTERPQVWKPPQLLDAPQPNEGYHHRWIRYQVNGVVDHKNMSARLREGYESVRAEEYPDFECPTLDSSHDKHAGTFTTGGLILCRIPEEIVKQRQQYFDSRADNADRAVDNDLLKANDPRMPFDASQRASRVTFGGGRS